MIGLRTMSLEELNFDIIFMNMFIVLKRNFFAVLVLVLFLIFIPVVIYLQFGTKKPTPRSQTPTINVHPTPIPSGFTKSYNNFNQLSPGKSNLSDIEKINGPAVSSSKKGNETYLYYQTPSTNYKNIVALKNNVLYYSLDNVFGDYRGTYSDYIASYGQPDLHLYNSDPNKLFDWYIFLKVGIGVENSDGGITRILYFTPKSKSDFMNGVAKEIELSINQPTPPPGFY
jgi:hypothetical protein